MDNRLPDNVTLITPTPLSTDTLPLEMVDWPGGELRVECKFPKGKETPATPAILLYSVECPVGDDMDPAMCDWIVLHTFDAPGAISKANFNPCKLIVRSDNPDVEVYIVRYA